MRTVGEIQDEIDALRAEMEAVGQCPEEFVCRKYNVDRKSEITGILGEEMILLEREQEEAEVRASRAHETLSRMALLSGLRLMPVERLMMETGF